MLTHLLKTGRSINNNLLTKQNKKNKTTTEEQLTCNICCSSNFPPPLVAAVSPVSRRHRSPRSVLTTHCGFTNSDTNAEKCSDSSSFLLGGGGKGQKNRTHCSKFLTTADRSLISQPVCQLYHKTPQATHTEDKPLTRAQKRDTRAVKHVAWGPTLGCHASSLLFTYLCW